MAMTLGAATSCVGAIDGAQPPAGSAAGSGSAGNPAVSGGMGSPGNGAPVIGPGDYLPTRIRRLSNAEYVASVTALLGTAPAAATSLAPDTRQSDFTINAGQRVDPVLASQLQAAALEAARASVSTALASIGCSGGDPCAQKLILDFGLRAFRRPLSDAEKADLLAVHQAGAMSGAFNDGIELVLVALLQSPSFLYVTELGGSPPKGDLVTLTPFEVASALSYLVTGGPPDRALLEVAAAGRLGTRSERETQARRLLALPAAQGQVRRFFKEWLGIDHLEGTGKDGKVYPKFEELRPHMAAETDAFIGEAVFNDEGTLSRLLSADYTVADPKLGKFYGLSGAPAGGRASLAGSARRGILTHASFLSVHASDHESGPVKRGATILKKVLCTTLPNPSELNIMVVPPRPDPKLTTRERFDVHTKDPACQACHRMIDALGFAFESFDGMGAYRTTENGRPVDTAVDLAPPLAGHARDSLEVIAKLAEAQETKLCFARNLFRFAAAQAGAAYENRFLEDVWLGLPPARALAWKELLVAYAGSESFVTRRVAP